jgi:hypothetical protein
VGQSIGMPQRSSQKSEVFGKLPDYGYSKEVAALIWQWYHPSKKVDAILFSKLKNSR